MDNEVLKNNKIWSAEFAHVRTCGKHPSFGVELALTNLHI